MDLRPVALGNARPLFALVFLFLLSTSVCQLLLFSAISRVFFDHGVFLGFLLAGLHYAPLAPPAAYG
jgi:hypothetical protein